MFSLKRTKRKTLLFLTEKAHALKDEYDSVSDEMGSIYYKGFFRGRNYPV